MGSDCCGGAGQKAHDIAGPSNETANSASNSHGPDHDHGHDHDHASHSATHQHGASSDCHSLASHDSPDQPQQHAHCIDDTDCATKGDICDDNACCESDDDCSQSATLNCCDSNEENCNDKCIAAAAALECERACEADVGNANHDHGHIHDTNGHHQPSACSTHLANAFDQYSAYLESARCICRSILERGWAKTCCDAQPRKAPVTGIKSVDSAGVYSTGRSLRPAHHHHTVKRRRNNKMHFRRAQDGHGHDHHGHGHSDGDSCHDKDSDCCSGHEIEHTYVAEKLPDATAANARDLEKAVGLEHLALHVEGMTCSGCGNKMEKTLKGLPGVSGVRVNFVMGTAECSVDTAVTTPDEVVRNAERGTNFKCTKLASDDQSLDILASGTVARSLTDLEILGVTSATIVNKKTVRVSYDPTIIGARTLLERLPSGNGGLAPPLDDPSMSSGRKRLYDQLVKTIVSAVLTIPVVVMAWGDNLVQEPTRAYISIVLATFVQLIAVPDFYRPAISALIYSRSIEMDMLVVISITAAYVYSVVAFGFRMAGKPLDTSEFFETSTLLITLVILGRLVAAFARVRAVAAVSLRSLQASTAVIVEKGQDVEIDARLLQYGDKFVVGPHTAVPTDGIVVSGSSEVDESMLTGESVPVFKKDGDSIIAGTINGTGSLVARLTRLPGKNTVTDIAQLVEEAANSKPRIQDYADRVASWFVPVVTSVAIIVVIVWLIVGLKIRHYSSGAAISNAITYAVATLAVSCPCALGLAVPMVLVVAGGIAARNGVIIKSADCTERARKVTDVVFDKTGTITEGDLDVMAEEYPGDNQDEAIAITKSLVAGNKHPVSLAVVKHVNERTSLKLEPTDVHVIPGAGVEAVLGNDKIRAGHPKWTETESDPVVMRLQSQGMTLLVVTRNSTPVAIYGLRTRLRSEATKVVGLLKRNNIAVHLVSGDLKRAVESVAETVGIPNVASQCTPAEKRDYVASLMEQGKKVMFVGDGTNDAVAVTQADVGVQLASVLSASDVTRGAADVVLLNGLEGIPFVMKVSSVAFRRMIFNFGWSAVYNVLAILLASGAMVNVRIPPAYAGLGEIVSVLPVIFAAATMLMKKIKVEE